jgi:TDG/mug DNA glycosylase family protein
LAPEEDGTLLEWGLGITNLVARATVSAAELAPEEYRAGARVLEEKVARFAPAWTAFVGLGAYGMAFGRKRVVVGPQDQGFAGSRVWVLPNTSGLNAQYTPARFAVAFRGLRDAVQL